MHHRYLIFACFLFHCFSGTVLSAQIITDEYLLHTHDHDDVAYHQAHEPVTHSGLRFIQNKGQWLDNIRYAAELGGLNQLFLEPRAFTYVLYDSLGTEEVHEYRHSPLEVKAQHLVDGHAYRVRFIGASQTELVGNGQRQAFNNYFLGQDPAKWAREVPVFAQIDYQQLYPGIALSSYSQRGNFKYDFIVQPGAVPGLIQLQYEGMDSLYLRGEDLVIETSVQTVTELAPYAYQMVAGQAKQVTCQYVLDGQRLSFAFPNGYDQNLPLIIDPTVIGATLSGTSTNQNFGHSATFDNAGNIYTAGISFGVGYPTTLGAFQANFAGGNTDVAISKYNPDGSALEYATYIGGTQGDYPFSTITDVSGNLVILGATLSDNYPTTATAVQADYGGGLADIFITKLNTNGTDLIGSTYLGGSDTDGIIEIDFSNGFPAEFYRGEVVLDEAANVYIASCSKSDDFPVSANAFQPQLSEVGNQNSQDGVVCRLSADLTALNWSTYLGGDGLDQCMGLRVKSNGNVYVAGKAAAANFPMVTGGQTPNWPGGISSAFLVEIAADGSSMVNGTFWGTNRSDQAYFMDTDVDNQVHIYGLTTGEMPITQNTYFFNPGSNQFLAAFTQDLSQLAYSTVIGTGSTGVDFIPVAFMVDRCNGIYFSGYYSEPGLPLTSDAIYTEANSFYLGVLTPNATDLSFGTYYGAANHVDGGTSRFDKAGIVYQGVCSCRIGLDDFVLNTTANAFATDQTTRCDVGVFKIDFEVDVITASAQVAPSAVGCAPFTVDFTYTGEDAETIAWDFGDGGSGSTQFDPTYTFEAPGTYIVTQIVQNFNSCNLVDTFQLQIEVLPSPTGIPSEVVYCISDGGVQLEALDPNSTYRWQDGSTSNTFQAPEAGIYWVEIGSNGCPRRDSFTVSYTSNVNVELGPDTFIVCDTNIFVMDAFNADAVTYRWQDGSSNSSFETSAAGTYFVQLTDATGCQVSDTINIGFGTFPVIDLGPDIFTCDPAPITFDATGTGYTYRWQDGSTQPTFTVQNSGTYTVIVNNDGCELLDSVIVAYGSLPEIDVEVQHISCAGETDGSIGLTLVTNNGPTNFNWSGGQTTPDINQLAPGIYTVTVSDDFDCPLISTVEVLDASPIVFTTTSLDPVCNDGRINFQGVSGGTPPYLFSVAANTFSPDSSFTNLAAGIFPGLVQDANGCLKTATLELVQQPGIVLDAGLDQQINLGDSIRLNPNISSLQNQALVWSPGDALNCQDCLRPFVRPTGNTTFLLTVTDTIRGCIVTDEVAILIDKRRRIYIPNAFSPNNDGINDRFYVFSDGGAVGIKSFRIFDRWGSLLHEKFNISTNNPQDGWDGLFNGKPMGSQVVVYAVEIEFFDGRTELFKGDMTVLD